jgi:hypothetical protein
MVIDSVKQEADSILEKASNYEIKAGRLKAKAETNFNNGTLKIE